MYRWTLLAPGHSLKDAPPALLTSGPVVTVNMAVLAPQADRATFWCAQDPARNFKLDVWGHVDPELRQNFPVIWCRDNRASEWSDLGFRVWPHPAIEEDFLEHFGLKTGEKFMVTGRTFFTALSRIVGHGARHITIYGCDLEGEGYSYGEDRPPDPRSDHWWSDNWASELKTLRMLVDRWQRTHGVEFLFMNHRLSQKLSQPGSDVSTT